MATWTKLANDWDSLTNANKLALFQQVTSDMPTITDLQALGKFKVITMSDNAATKVVINGVHNKTNVLPNNVFSVASYAKINSITLNSNIVGGGQVGLAVTKDLATYYVYDTNAWKVIDVDNDAFMTPTQFNALTDAEWQALLGTDTTLGIAYSVELSSLTDAADIDSITLNVDMTGMWEKAEYGTDYKYAYSNSSISIDLLKNGDYKINYPIGSASSINTGSVDLVTEADIKKLFKQRSVI